MSTDTRLLVGECLRCRAILILAATIGYEQQPEFPVKADTQLTMPERIAYEIRHGSGPLARAVEAEGLAGDWKADDRPVAAREVKAKL